MEMEGQNKIKKILKKIFSIIYNLITIVCVLLIAVIVIQRVWDNEKSFAGYRFFTVISGSMVPKYDIGEVVICKETDPSEFKVGDSIVYKGKEGIIEGKRILHEIVSIKDGENGKKIISAKGITNNVIDPEISEDDIYGVVKYKSRLLTFLYFLAMKKETSFIIIMILVINVFISFKLGNKDEYENALGESKEIEEEKNKKEKDKEDKVNNIEENKEIIEEETEKENEAKEEHTEEDSNLTETAEINIDKLEKKIKVKKAKK